MKKDWFKNLLKSWADTGWVSLVVAILFFILYLRKNSNEYNLYLSIGFFIVSLVQLFFKYKKIIHNK